MKEDEGLVRGEGGEARAARGALRRLSDGGKSHPHIVGFKGYFERAEKHYIVMEACTGGELFERVTGSQALSEEEGRGLFLQLVCAGASLFLAAWAARRMSYSQGEAADAPGGSDKGPDGNRIDSIPIANGVISNGCSCQPIHYVPAEHDKFFKVP